MQYILHFVVGFKHALETWRMGTFPLLLFVSAYIIVCFANVFRDSMFTFRVLC